MKKTELKRDLKTEIETELRFYESFFREIWKGKRPLGKLFRTPSRGYLYDTGTNKIIGCHYLVFSLLEHFFTKTVEKAIADFLNIHDMDEFLFAANTIKSGIETERILKAQNIQQLEFASQTFDYKALIESSLEILLLEMTSRCNLRCKYCVYDGHVKDKRNHSNDDMSLPVAYKAVDYLKAHSVNKDTVAVSFFGGEPLVDYPKMQKVVEYSRTVLDKKELIFFVTTNGTLITPDIATYFFQNNFTVFVSIDGPEDIHDDYRTDGSGKGSFQKSIEGVKTLIDAYGEKAEEKIRFSMVYTPPFSEKRLNRIAELWEQFPWLPRNMNLSISYPSSGTIPPEKAAPDAQEDKTLIQWAAELYYNKFIGKGDSHPIADAIMEKNLAMVEKLPVYDNPTEHFYPSGCCIPGVKRLYVSTDGAFRICERISTYAPTIGNVYSGIDMEKLQKIYMDDYESISAPLCTRCWAIRLCTACYVEAFNNESLDVSCKAEGCQKVKSVQESMLEYYCTLKELRPEGLHYLHSYEFT